MKCTNAIITSDYGLIIVNINDTVVGRHIGMHGYWAADDINLMKALIDHQLRRFETITFYDVGANIGTHSLAIAKSFGQKLKVRAFEAQRLVFNMLCGTMAINGLTNVHCYHNAVSDTHNDTIDIALPDYGVRGNFASLEVIAPLRSDNQDLPKVSSEKIRTLCLDSFDEKVDFIKMDVEGMEDKALVGARRTIRAHRPVCYVEVLKTDADFILGYFRELKYDGFLKGHDLIAIPGEYRLRIDGLKKIL